MKEKILNDYLLKQQKIDIEKVMDDFYSYVYIIARNSVSTCITEEDIEEIVSDVFVGIWKNSSQLLPTYSGKTISCRYNKECCEKQI